MLTTHNIVNAQGLYGKFVTNCAVVPTLALSCCALLYLNQRRTISAAIAAGGADQSALRTADVSFQRNVSYHVARRRSIARSIVCFLCCFAIVSKPVPCNRTCDLLGTRSRSSSVSSWSTRSSLPRCFAYHNVAYVQLVIVPTEYL